MVASGLKSRGVNIIGIKLTDRGVHFMIACDTSIKAIWKIDLKSF